MTEPLQEESIEENVIGGAPLEDESAASDGSTKMTPGERLRREKAAAAARKAAIKTKVREDQESSVISATPRAPKAVDFDKTEAGRAVNKTATWLEKNRMAIAGGALALVAVVALVVFLSTRSMNASTETGVALYEGVHAASGVVQAAGETTEETRAQVFDTVAARNTAAAAGFAKVHDGAPAGWARLSEARIALESGNFAEAETKFDAVYRGYASNAYLAAQALEGVAISREQQNNFNGAIEKYQALATFSNGRYRASGEYGVARIKVRRGQGQDRTEARTSLRELVDRLHNEQRAENASREFASPFTLSQAETLLRVLDPTATPPSSPGLDGMSQEQLQQLLQRLGQGQGQQ